MKHFFALFIIIFTVSALPFSTEAKLFNKFDPTIRIRVTPPAPQFSDAERQAELKRRRDKVFEAMADNSAMILISAEPKIYTNDVDYPFRQENNLYYLTALKQQHISLVLTKQSGKKSEFLFMRKRNALMETWDGKMYSNEDAGRISGIGSIIGAGEFDDFLIALQNKEFFKPEGGTGITTTFKNIYFLLPENDTDTNGMREFRRETETAEAFRTVSDAEIKNAQPIFAELRSVKSPYEIKLMQHAIDITTEALMRAMATAGKSNWEYETQAEVEYIFRKRNADFWGYPSIVGCGENATTLHYIESQGKVESGKLLLMDVGAEYEHYTADVTRTFPVNGTFTKEQREIYQIVYDAQEAAAAKIKPGNRFAEPNAAAREAVDKGLAQLGLITAPGAFIPGTEREVPDGNGGTRKVGTPQSFLWFMHGLGHWLGMNVHDVGGTGATVFKSGMMMTNEPGIYIRPDTLDNLPDTPEMRAFITKIRPAFEKYKSIGIRIEDDMLVTDGGTEWMTKNLPRKADEIELFMKTASKEFSAK